MRIAWCGVVAGLVLSTGCSDEQSLSEKYPTQWKTCKALFGAQNMDSLRDMIDSDALKISTPPLSVSQLKKGLTKEALEPYDKRKGFSEFDVCRMSGNGTFQATVAWSADTLKAVQFYTKSWNRVDKDVYVSRNSNIYLVFRCDINGASTGQQKQVLLGARVSPSSNPRFSAAFHQQLTVNLTRTLKNELACTNKPNIPDDLQLSK
ncbi:hypothetical protein AB0L47_08415 [Streptomyces bobili]|uniref:hypothetical protein n=1 Tax=Streptomyces bobili TaxID=67280 RepID=UPI003414D922